MTQALPERRTLRERLEFIDFRLLWDGRVNRGDVMGAFGISAPQATADFRRYLSLAGDRVGYDSSVKAYTASEHFQPALLQASSEQFLLELELQQQGGLAGGRAWAKDPPDCATLPKGQRSIPVQSLLAVLRAIRSRSKVHIQYHSLSRPDATWRWIAPHGLATDGVRWHTRAWCFENHEFRDFVFARMVAVGELEASTIPPDLDHEWSTYVILQLAPHPALTDHERKVVELDYGMSNGLAHIHTRACLFRYLEWHLRLDLDDMPRPAARNQVVLRNRAEVLRKREEARQLTKDRWSLRLS